MFKKTLTYAYRELISNPSRRLPFWVLIGFVGTFVVARTVVGVAPSVFLQIHGTHVHHFTYGIFVLAAVGLITLLWARPGYVARRVFAILYGIGLSLSFDEFGMWLHLTSEYNLDQSQDVMVAILVILILLVYGLDIVRRMRRQWMKLAR